MPIFISYNHEDADFVESLAANLVRLRHNVWIDKWEINAGESLIDRIQVALGDADAILVIISNNSLKSEWCKKELNAGLVRELSERRVLLIPCVVDECSIPMFLREKLYVDFKKGWDQALDLLDRSLSSVSNPLQSRVEEPDYYTDWSVDCGMFADRRPFVEWLFVDHGKNVPYSVVTRCRMLFDDQKAVNEYQVRMDNGGHFNYACENLEKFLKRFKGGDYRVLIKDSKEIVKTTKLTGVVGEKIIISVGVRRIGTDTGMDTVFSIDNVFRSAIEHFKNATRKS